MDWKWPADAKISANVERARPHTQATYYVLLRPLEEGVARAGLAQCEVAGALDVDP